MGIFPVDSSYLYEENLYNIDLFKTEWLEIDIFTNKSFGRKKNHLKYMFKNPMVRDFLISILRFWSNKGLKFWVMVVLGIQKRISGLDCIFWAHMILEIRSKGLQFFANISKFKVY